MPAPVERDGVDRTRQSEVHGVPARLLDWCLINNVKLVNNVQQVHDVRRRGRPYEANRSTAGKVARPRQRSRRRARAGQETRRVEHRLRCDYCKDGCGDPSVLVYTSIQGTALIRTYGTVIYTLVYIGLGTPKAGYT